MSQVLRVQGLGGWGELVVSVEEDELGRKEVVFEADNDGVSVVVSVTEDWARWLAQELLGALRGEEAKDVAVVR